MRYRKMDWLGSWPDPARLLHVVASDFFKGCDRFPFLKKPYVDTIVLKNYRQVFIFWA